MGPLMVGDVVRLTAGGPKMTVTGVDCGPEHGRRTYICVYATEYGFFEKEFLSGTLDLVEEEGK